MKSDSGDSCECLLSRRLRIAILVFIWGGPGFWIYRLLMNHDRFIHNFRSEVLISTVVALSGAVIVYFLGRPVYQDPEAHM